MLLIRRALAALLLLCAAAILSGGFAQADPRQVYTVADVRVNATAATPIEAQERAFANARYAAARRLIERLTLEEDRNRSGALGFDQAQADQMAVAVDVQEEQRSAGRYRGTLAVVFNPQAVRSYLRGLDVPFLDTQAPQAVLIPQAALSDRYAWRAALGAERRLTLAPYVSTESASPGTATDWTSVQSFPEAAGARRAVAATLNGREGRYSADVTVLTPSGAIPLGRTAVRSDIPSVAALVQDRLEDSWKRQSIVRDASTTVAQTTVLFTSLPEWNTLRGALAQSPLVSNFVVVGVSRDGALVRFSFAGDKARLENGLRQAGIDLEDGDRGWIMQTAATPGTRFR